MSDFADEGDSTNTMVSVADQGAEVRVPVLAARDAFAVDSDREITQEEGAKLVCERMVIAAIRNENVELVALLRCPGHRPPPPRENLPEDNGTFNSEGLVSAAGWRRLRAQK